MIAEKTSDGIIHLEQSEVSDAEITAFTDLVNAGIAAWKRAGELLVSMVEKDPLTFKKIRRQCPTISSDILLAFERVGRRLIFPKLLLDSSPGSKRLLSMPYEMQERFSSEKVQILVKWHPEKPQFTEKHIQELSAPEVEQVIGVDDVRTLEQQHMFVSMRPGGKKRGKGTARVRQDWGSELKTVGYYRLILGSNGVPRIEPITGDFPYAIPIEITSASESEPFQIISIIK